MYIGTMSERNPGASPPRTFSQLQEDAVTQRLIREGKHLTCRPVSRLSKPVSH
jgi:hypothetical protein